MTYQVLVCPDSRCREVNIVKKDGSDTSKCISCDTQRPKEKYKIAYTSDSREDAVAARTKLLLKLNDDDMTFDEAVDKGYIYNDDLFNEPEKDTRSVKEIVRDTIRELDKPDKEDIVEQSTEHQKVTEEKAQKAIEGMTQDGEIIEYKSHLELLV